MRIDLPRCNFNNCHWCQDHNCYKKTRDMCDYYLSKLEVEKLTQENNSLKEALTELSDNIGLLKDKTKTNTVQKMTEMLKRRLPVISPSVFDHVARAVLEENK